MLVIESGGATSSNPVVVTNSTDGSTSDTGIATGGYSGKDAKIIETHASVEKAGPLFVPYDPLLAALLSINF